MAQDRLYLNFPDPQLDLADDNPVEFNELSSTGIAFNPVTFRFTLAADTKYKLVNNIAVGFSAVDGFISFAWFDHNLSKTFGAGGEIFAADRNDRVDSGNFVSKKFETFFQTILQVEISLIIVASTNTRLILRDDTFLYVEEVNNFTNVVLAIGGGAAYSRVQFFSGLPAPGSATAEIFVVEEREGTVPGFRKNAGFYLSDGVVWTRLGNLENSSAIKTLYEANTNTNVFTDADQTFVQKFDLTGVQDGDILIYNVVSGKFEPGVGGGGGGALTPKDDRFVVTAPTIISRTFVLSFTPVANSEIVRLNGAYAKRGIHYTIVSNTITIDNSVSLTLDEQADIIDVTYWV